MDKKLMKIIEPGIKLTFFVLFAFALVTFAFSIQAGVIELATVVLLYVYYRSSAKKRSDSVGKYVENMIFNMDNASKNSLMDFPLPMMILQLDSGTVIWGNDSIGVVLNAKEHIYGMSVTEAIDGFDTRWLLEGKAQCPYDVKISERYYNISGNIVRNMKGDTRTPLATIYLTDVTELHILNNKYIDTRPIVAIIMIDSYEELLKGMSESEKSQMLAQIEKELTFWAETVHGIIRKLERDRYMFIFENADLEKYTEEKFVVLEKTREIKNSEGICATISIGIGKDGENLYELYQFSTIALDMALSRGGDQAVIKSPNSFEFYGGSTKEVEKRTKVKARVVANSLKQLINDSTNVFIMGHKYSDLDCLGAAVGMACAVRCLGKKPYILIDEKATSAKPLLDRLHEQEEYKEVLIGYDDAMLTCNAGSLLIIVDTNRPDMVEYSEMLDTIPRVALIDHHRRAAVYIENTAVSMHEPYASSTCELISELLQYMVPAQCILRCESEGLLAGIYLDTKGFSVKTGVRTFEAAAYLKQLGADTLQVKNMFYNDFDSYIKKYQIISSADEIAPGVTATYIEDVTERAIAAAAADELINIKGIKASFVIFMENTGVCVSARSYGQLNVQVVLEKIGGGGSLTMAGAQFGKEETPLQVFEMVRRAVDEYLSENKS